jgi:CubicO group peptidase (beta-lactamase class C family)
MKENIKFISIAFLIIVSLFVFPALAQNAITAKIDEFIKAEMQKQKIPGVSLAVIRDGQIIYAKGYGYANVEHQVPVKTETIFQSGSVGKQFTAMAIMILVEDGKIGLDDKINKYFTDAPAEWNNITIRHLLTHTSGMRGYPEDFNFRADYTEDSLYKIIKTLPLAFQPGEKWDYSNIGYATLGILISRVTGKFYGDFLKERVFNPLGMTTARIITEADIVPNRAAGYILVNGELKNQRWVSPSSNTTADGSLYLTILDMAKWEAALNGGKVLQRKSYDEMWKPVKLNNSKTHPYGFGWAISYFNGKRIIEHGGRWQGFESDIKRFPEEKLTVVVFANLRNANLNKLARSLLEMYHPQLSIAAAKVIEDKEPKVTALVKEFLQKTIDEKATPELFTPEAGALILSQSKQAAEYFKSLGTLNNIELLERRELESGSRLYRYRLTYSSTKLEFIITLTKDNKIDEIKL